jgi:hypothetical protein
MHLLCQIHEKHHVVTKIGLPKSLRVKLMTKKKKNSGPLRPGVNEVSFRARPHANDYITVHELFQWPQHIVITTCRALNLRASSMQPVHWPSK